MTPQLALLPIATTDLAALLDQIGGLLPMLQGQQTQIVERIPEEQLVLLHDTIAAMYPAAGKVYWSARTWQVWTWQSVYVNVIAVHRYGVALDITTLLPHVEDDFVSGFTIGAQPVTVLGRDAAMRQAQQSCLAWIARYAPVVCQFGGFSAKLARQYSADSMLGAFMYMESQSMLSKDEALYYSQLWVQGLALPKPSTIRCIDQPVRHLLLENAVCCQHYRRDPDNLCAGCPRKKTGRVDADDA
jgi:siderophore ferric iron reductase